MSKRMKEYYQNHPEEKEKLSKVLTKAWGLNEAKSIRKKMSKFLGKANITSEEFVELNYSNNDNKNLLKEFWDKNAWAKAQWSKCMTKAWSIIKKEKLKQEEPDYIIEIYPKTLKADMLSWMKQNGYDITKLTERNLQARITIGDKENPKAAGDDYAHKAISAYFEREENLNLRADMLQIAMIKTYTDLLEVPKCTSEEQALRDTIVHDLRHKLFAQNNLPTVLTTSQALDIYTKLVAFTLHSKGDKFAKIFEDNLETAYYILENHDDALLRTIVQRANLVNSFIK